VDGKLEKKINNSGRKKEGGKRGRQKADRAEKGLLGKQRRKKTKDEIKKED